MKNIIDSGGFNAVVKTKHGFMMYNKNDSYIGQALLLYGEFSEDEVRLFQHVVQPGDVVVEVGANIGALTLPLARMVAPHGRVKAFEPQRIVYQTLCANMALNSLVNVECLQLAVGDQPGVAKVPVFNFNQNAKLNFGGVSLLEDWAKVLPTEPVPVVVLDQFLENVPAVKLVKLDVEGMEPAVLEGGKNFFRRCRPFIYLENDRLDQSQALIEQLWSMDYRLFWHMAPMFNPKNFAGITKNIFLHMVSANMLAVPKGMNLPALQLEEVLNSSDHPVRRSAAAAAAAAAKG